MSAVAPLLPVLREFLHREVRPLEIDAGHSIPPEVLRGLAELGLFGVTLPEDVQIRVWDSTAEVRYLVVPMRPPGTDGWSEERLATLVTRDSMIGTGLAAAP